MVTSKSLLKGRYRIERQLGDGGMAIVFVGHDLHLGRDVAIKTLRPQFAADPAFRARFEREARAAATLAHPNIIDVYDVGEVDGVPFLVMELIRGQSLKEIIAAEAPFHPDDVAELIEQIGRALDYAHARGYVHRDVKPGNILLDEHGRARVVDFGIAKGLFDSDLTTTNAGLGTVGYLSPEQAEGLMATPASDVYSSGVVAFEMLTGRVPFQAETPVGVAMQHVNESAPPPSRLQPGVPPQVDAIVLRALEKDPTRRWPSVGAFARALRQWRQTGALPVSTPATAAAGARRKSSSMPTLAVIVLVAGALAALLWAGFHGLPAPTADPTRAELAPLDPTITGGIGPADRTTSVDRSVIEPQDEPVTQQPAAPVENIGPPTIAPASRATAIVPDLQGLTIADSTKALLPLGLRIALAQPAFSDSVPMNAVVAQDPPAGAAVAPGTTVRVSLSRGPSPFGDQSSP